MLTYLLISSLFFGLIVMLLPTDRKSDWIYVIIIAVLFLSFFLHFSRSDFSISLPEIPIDATSASVEEQALSFAVSQEVFRLTGGYPARVECDLTSSGEEYTLSKIHVIISEGDAKEVEYALQKTFAFSGFTVTRESFSEP